jgi:hypothetical protein
VNRVNLLCELYDKAYRQDDREVRKTFQSLVDMAGRRGYPKGLDVLQSGLAEKTVRKICWNISSLLSDEDVNHIRNECS